MRVLLLAIGVVTCAVLPAMAAETRKLVDVPSYITGLVADDDNVYWGEQRFDDPGKGGLYRRNRDNNKVEALWTERGIDMVRLAASEVFFVSRMGSTLTAYAKATGEVRVVLDDAGLDAAVGTDGTYGIEDYQVVGDQLVVAISTFGPCKDDSGALVSLPSAGGPAKVLARGCLNELSIADGFAYWRVWGPKSDDGKRGPDKIVRVALKGGKVETLVTASLYLDPVALNGAVYYVDDAMAGGVVRYDLRTKKSTLLVPYASVRLVTDGKNLYGIDPFKGTLDRYDVADKPTGGKPERVTEVKGLSLVAFDLIKVFYSACDAPKHCELESYTWSDVDMDGLDLLSE